MMQDNHYNWTGVLQFLHKQHETHCQNQNLWFMEKKTLQQQIKQLEGRVNALETINADLQSRNRMLQYCLRQIKGQQKSAAKQEVDNPPKMPQRRPKPNKNHINKILQSLGIKNLLENIQKDIQAKGLGEAMKMDQKLSTHREKEKAIAQIKSSVYKQHMTLSGHQDGVRDLSFVSDKELLVSVSEDCTMKIWDLKEKQNNCLGTIRQHGGPIFTLTNSDKYLYSGGMEGVIRVWDFSNVEDKKDVGRKNLVGVWNNTEDDKLQPIWQLLHSSQHKLLFSTSSEVSIKAYSINNSDLSNVRGQFKKSYQYTQRMNSKQDEDIPTSICVHGGNLVAGFVTNQCLAYFDLETGKICQQLKFPANGQVSTNKIVSHPNVLLGAFEDKMVRLFDKNKMTYSFKAHDDSVMSIALTANSNQFFTCGHDGFVKLWDLRKVEPISSFKAHTKKYDESVHCLSSSSNYKSASGGADAIIKVFKANA